MVKRGWSTRIVLKYALLQVPGLVLVFLILIGVRRWLWDMPTWVLWGILGVWVAKDIILFPFVWRAYDSDRQGDSASMVGMRGIAKDRLDPSGYVEVRGELWKAEVMGDAPSIEKEEKVRVEGMKGLTLLVQPVRERND